MKIGIIVFSRSGLTLSAAKALHEILNQNGHESVLEILETVEPLSLSAVTAELKAVPDITPYDGLVIACAVQGGLPSVPMRVYLDTVENFKGKPAAFLIGGIFPYDWGRKQTLDYLVKACEEKDANLLGDATIRWSTLFRGKQINEAVKFINSLFKDS